jgi:hypothetical protein
MRKNVNVLYGLGIFIFLAGLLWNACLHGGDFKVFYLAGERLLGNLPIYQVGDGWSPFKYHPSWAVFFSVWALLPFGAAVLLFNVVNILFWFLASRYWARALNYEFGPQSIFVLLFLSLNALSSETAYGQVNGFLFWGATQIFRWMESENQKPVRSGILLAVLVSLKLNLGILLVYVLYKNWRSAWGLMAGALGLHLLTAVAFKDFYNVGLYQSWLHLLLTQSGDQFNTFEVQGILRMCYVLFGASLAKSAWAALLASFVFLGIYLDRAYLVDKDEAEKKRVFNACYWLAVVFFFSPLAWWYQVLYLFPIAFLLLKTSPQKIWQGVIWSCLLCFAVVSFNTLGREGIFIFKLYMGYFAAGLALFAGLLVSYVKSGAQVSSQRESSVIELSFPTPTLNYEPPSALNYDPPSVSREA